MKWLDFPGPSLFFLEGAYFSTWAQNNKLAGFSSQGLTVTGYLDGKVAGSIKIPLTPNFVWQAMNFGPVDLVEFKHQERRQFPLVAHGQCAGVGGAFADHCGFVWWRTDWLCVFSGKGALLVNYPNNLFPRAVRPLFFRFAEKMARNPGRLLWAEAGGICPFTPRIRNNPRRRERIWPRTRGRR